MTSPRKIDLASEVVLMGLVAGTPLAFGSVEVWATEAMKWGILIFVLLRIARRWSDPQARARSVSDGGGILRGAGLLVPACLFVGLVLLQLLPLPSSLIHVLSPGADAVYRQTVPGYPGRGDFSGVEGHLLGDPSAPRLAIAGEGAVAPPPRSQMTLSIYPDGTWEQLGLLLAYLLLFFAAADYASDPARRVRLLVGFVASGFCIAAFALVQKLTWNGKIFWLRPAPTTSGPVGPFVNPNHFAGYMELVLPVSVGLLLMVWRLRRQVRVEEEVPEPEAGIISFPRLESSRPPLFSHWGEAALSKTAFTLCALVMAVLAIIASRSLGGLIATSLTFTLFVGMIVPREMRKRAVMVGAFGILGMGFALVLASAGISTVRTPLAKLTQLGIEPSFATRWMTWKEVTRLIGEHPIVGTGLGTFREAYNRYHPEGIDEVWVQAHNDYLQLTAEAGLVGAVLLLTGLLLYARRVFLPALRMGPSREICLGIAMALVSMALHSFVDFNLQIPSNGLLTVLLAGVLAGIVLSRDREGASDREA